MRILSVGNRRQRRAYASKEEVGKDDNGAPVYEFYMSPLPATTGNYRPVARFDSQQDLERAALEKGHLVTWQQ